MSGPFEPGHAALRIERGDVAELVSNLRNGDAPAALATLQRVADRDNGAFSEYFERAKFSVPVAGASAGLVS